MFIPIYGLTRPQVPKYLIRHSNILKSIWDSIILICILYTSAMVPFLVAFQVQHKIIVIIDTFVDCMFIIDIILTFFTTYVGPDGEFVTNSKMIRKNYMKSWFALDCLAALPYSVLSFALNNPVICSIYIKKQNNLCGLLFRTYQNQNNFSSFGKKLVEKYLKYLCLNHRMNFLSFEWFEDFASNAIG